MKITQEEIVDRQTVLQIELDEADVAPYVDQGYRRVVQRVMIPGFRKGKAPRAIVERFLGRESLLQESLDSMIHEVTERAIAEQSLDTAGTPAVEVVDLEPVTLKATVALTPEVDLGHYRDMRIPEEPVEVTEDDIDKSLGDLQKTTASWDPAERPVRMGDMVTMSVRGTVDGRSVLDEEDSVILVEEGSVVPLPDFSKHVEGAEPGVAKEFDLPVADDFADANMAGKVVHFSVTVGEVKEQHLPDLDDEFARGVGDGHESLEALRQSVEDGLRQEAESAQKTQHREAVLDELTKIAAVELPPLLVDHEVGHMVDRRDRFVDRLKIRMDDYLRYTGKTEDEIREEMREEAVERLSRSWALATLAEREGLEVSDQEIDGKVKELAEAGGDSVRGHDLESPEVRGSIRESQLVEKAVERLTAIAKGELDGSAEQPGPEGERQAKERGDSVDADA